MRLWSLLPWPGWNFKWIFGNTFCNNIGDEGSVSAWTIRGKDQENYGVMCGFEVDCVWNVMARAQKPDFAFRRNGRVHLNRRGRQFSRLLAAEVCESAVVLLDTPSSEVVWRVLATHAIRQFSLHFPSRVPSHFNWTLHSQHCELAGSDFIKGRTFPRVHLQEETLFTAHEIDVARHWPAAYDLITFFWT